MPNHTIFNERLESQDRALKVIEKLGYTIVPRSEAEKKRGSRPVSYTHLDVYKRQDRRWNEIDFE